MFPIVEKLGGWPEVEKVLDARGITASEAARKKWRARQLPRDVAVALGSEASSRGINFDFADFEFQRTDERAS